MRLIALGLALVLSTAVAHADEEEEVTVRVPVRLLDFAVTPERKSALFEQVSRQASEGRAMRNGGIGTVVAGTILTAIGVGLFMNGFCIDGCSGGDNGTFGVGVAALVLGQVGVLTGVPLWASGQAAASHADQVKLSMSSTSLQIQF